MSSSETWKTLDSSNELQITVTGRKTGRKRSTPIWFIREGKTVFLLPGGGFKSQWYKNAIRSKQIKISSGKISLDLTPKQITEPKNVASIVDRFRKKYGERWYSGRFDVAVEVTLPSQRG